MEPKPCECLPEILFSTITPDPTWRIRYPSVLVQTKPVDPEHGRGWTR